MATRFLALASAEPDALETACDKISKSSLRPIHRSSRVAVFLSRDGCHIASQNGSSLVIGHLFERSPRPQRVKAIDQAMNDRLISSKGDALLRDFWGGYAAILLPDQERHEVHIVRDPSGAMPCYYLKCGGFDVISSDVETLLDVGLLSVGIDWMFFVEHLTAPDLRTPSTCLDGLIELLPGHRLTIGSCGPLTAQVWSPWDFTEPTNALSDNDVAEALFEVVDGSVEAWARTFEHVLLGVSGGLDSSVVAKCVARAGTRLTCLTLVTSDPSGDERVHASSLTDSLELPLFQAFYELSHVDIEVSTSGHLPRPVGFALGQSNNRAKFEIAAQRATDAFFSGVGGDNIFCHMQSATPLIDRVVTHGLGRGSWETLNDICRMTDCSLFQAIGMAIDRSKRKSPDYIWMRNERFLNTQALAAIRTPSGHPWLTPPFDALPGKAVHVAMLTRAHGTIDGYSRVALPPQILPLLSQPIVEFCLSVPTWRWCRKGQNRYPVRNGFRCQLPASILSRRVKGGPNSFAFEIIDNNRRKLRDHFLGGALRDQGLLDVAALEEALGFEGKIRAPDHVYLSTLGEAESWARLWLSRRTTTQDATSNLLQGSTSK